MVGLCLSISPSFSVTGGGGTTPRPPRSQGDGVAFPASASSIQAPPSPEGKASRSHRGQGRTAWDPDGLGSVTVPTQATGQPHICRDRMEPSGWEVPLQETGGKECFPSPVPYLPACYFPELRRESEGFTPGKGTCRHTLHSSDPA